MPAPIPPRGPKGEFLFGNLREFTNDTLQFILNARQYGDFVQAMFGPFPFFIVNDPELAHEVMVTRASSFYKSAVTKQVLKETVGDGLFTNDGDSWKRQRKLAQPAFHTRRIATYAEVMVEYTRQMLDHWQSGKVLDMEREMSALTMQIVAKTLFDADINGEEDDLARAVKTVLQTVDKRFNRLIPVPAWLPIPENRDMKQSIAVMDRIIQGFIDDRRKTGEDRGDLLSMLMAAMDDEGDGTGMSDRQLRDEAMTVFGAGHETTSGALTWTFYLLSQHPAVEAKLLAELHQVLGDRLPTFEDLPNLPYTEMVIKETMRLYPPAWSVTRESVEAVTIGGYPVAKQNTIMINIYGMHRDERYFPNPLQFDPERFSAENEKNIPRYAYLPFGAGPRICIGNAFAMMEARLILATIMQRYQLQLAPGQVVEPQRVFTLRPKFGMKLVTQTRQKTTQPVPELI